MLGFHGGAAALGAGLVLGCLAASASEAAVLTENAALIFSGSLLSDDDIGFHEVELAVPFALQVAFESFSYAGGILRDGTIVAAGGFDPVLSLFDGDGRLIGFGDDGLRRKDPVTGDPYDAYLDLTLAPGSYLLTVTQYDNYPNASLGGFLSAGFSREGEENFTGGPCGAPAFCDSGAFSRTPDYVVQVATPSTIPLPGGLGLLLGAVAVLGAIGVTRTRG